MVPQKFVRVYGLEPRDHHLFLCSLHNTIPAGAVP